MITDFTRLRLIDLDCVIQLGCELDRHHIKDKKGNTINLGGLNMLVNLLAESYKSGACTVIFARDMVRGIEKDVISCRDWLSRLQYEIVLDKLSSTGFQIRKFNSNEELENELYEMTKSGYATFPTIRVYTDLEKPIRVVDYGGKLSIYGHRAVDGFDHYGTPAETVIMSNGYTFYRACKDGNLGARFPKIYDDYEEYMKALNSKRKRNALVISSDIPDNVLNFCMEQMNVGVLSEEELVSVVNRYLDYREELSKHKEYNWEPYHISRVNKEGFKAFLELFNFDFVLNFTGLMNYGYTLPGSAWVYRNELLGKYMSGEKQEEANIAYESEYSLNEEKSLTNYFEDNDIFSVINEKSEELSIEDKLNLNDFI